MKSLSDFLEALKEGFKYRVDWHGDKIKKLNCPPGYRPNAAGTACIPMDSEMKLNLKMGAKQSLRDKRSQGDALKRKTLVHTKKALRYRKMFGLEPQAAAK